MKPNLYTLKVPVLSSALFVLINTAKATTYYVESANSIASDLNPGTAALPWLTINKAALTMVAGDTVLVKAGTYNVTGTNTRFLPALNPANSGTASDPIVFMNFCNDSVTITQSGFRGPLIGSYQRNYIVWSGFKVIEAPYATTPPTPNNTEYNITVMWSDTGCVIKNCEIVGELNTSSSDNHIGVRTEHAVSPLIRNCKIHDVKNATNPAASKGIDNWYTYSTPQNLIIENCEIYNCGGGISNHEGGVNNIYRNNFIHNCTERGITINTQNQSPIAGGKIYQNIIVQCGYKSIQFNSPGSNDLISNFEIFNNTIYTSTGDNEGEISTSINCPNQKIWNNIIVQSGSHVTIFAERYTGTSAIFYFNYNCYDVNGQFVLNQYTSTPLVYGNLAAWQTGAGHDVNSFIANPLFTNPLFISPITYGFQLQSGSPCINAGIDRQDYNNNSNTTESINMGAYINSSDTIGVYAIPLPSVTIAPSGSTTFCQGGNVTLTASSGTSYLWSSGATSQSIVVTSSQTDSVTVTDANGCLATSNVITVTVNPLPTVALQQLNPDTVCISDGSFILSGGSPTSGTYTGNGVTGGMFDPTLAGTGTHTITYTYSDANGCTDSASQTIYVDVCTGVMTQNNNASVLIYPNPNSGIFTVETTEKEFELIITNTLGEQILSRNVSGEKIVIDFSDRPAGIYFVEVKTDKGSATRKTIANK